MVQFLPNAREEHLLGSIRPRSGARDLILTSHVRNIRPVGPQKDVILMPTDKLLYGKFLDKVMSGFLRLKGPAEPVLLWSLVFPLFTYSLIR